MGAIVVEPLWVDDDQTLAELCQRWSAQAAIAVDTEFERSTTFYPRAALIQVGDGRGCYLIDPLAIGDFEPLRRLFTDPAVIKVMHSCSEDLEVFQSFLQVVPSPLIDTQLAAAFAGEGFSLGYAALVDRLLGVSIPKSETRSDWLQRPLSQAQLQYAAVDVAYLLVAYGVLLKTLRQQQRLDWVEADCAAIVAQAEAGVDPEVYYERIKLAWKLDRRQLAVLRHLSSWREREARVRDVPRNRLIKEQALWQLAVNQPTQIRQLRAIEGIPPRVIKSDGDTLLELIAEALALPERQLPERLPAPLSRAQGDLLKRLRARLRNLAGELQLAPEVLARKKDLEELIRSGDDSGVYQLGTSLSGWREAVVGRELLALLAAEGGAAND